MHVLLTHEAGSSHPELGAIRDMLIMAGMSVITIAHAPSSRLASGQRFTLLSEQPDFNPVYGVSGSVGQAIGIALHEGLQAQLCVVLTGFDAEANGGTADTALAVSRLGVPVLNVCHPVGGAASVINWLRDLTVEIAALMLAQPMPGPGMLIFSAPSHMQERKPKLIPACSLATRGEAVSDAGTPVHQRVRQRTTERDAHAHGWFTLTLAFESAGFMGDERNSGDWIHALVASLHSRLSGAGMRCACCEPISFSAALLTH